MTGRLSGVACAALGLALGCGGPSAPTGRILAAITVTGSAHDVAQVAFAIVGATDTCAATALASATVPLAGRTAGGGELGSDAGAGHLAVDNLFVLSPGDYRVCATPLAGSGGPSAYCATAEAWTTVVAEATSDVTLVSQCTTPSSGGVSGTLGLNDPPQITGVTIPSAAAVDTCSPATISVVASDPNGDALSYGWSIVSGPAGATLVPADSSAALSATTAGIYELEVRVRDALGAETVLTFPVHVSAGTCDAGP